MLKVHADCAVGCVSPQRHGACRHLTGQRLLPSGGGSSLFLGPEGTFGCLRWMGPRSVGLWEAILYIIFSATEKLTVQGHRDMSRIS
ncbi:unnamed protein product [Calypogeia fissa]